MKWILNIVGVIMILVGLVWILQGVNILGGSFMSGKILYSFLGIGLGVVGLIVLAVTNRGSRAGTKM